MSGLYHYFQSNNNKRTEKKITKPFYLTVFPFFPIIRKTKTKINKITPGFTPGHQINEIASK